MTNVHVVACNQCRYMLRLPPGPEGEARARAAAFNHAASNGHPVARYQAELVELVEPAGAGVAYGVEVNSRDVQRGS